MISSRLDTRECGCKEISLSTSRIEFLISIDNNKNEDNYIVEEQQERN